MPIPKPVRALAYCGLVHCADAVSADGTRIAYQHGGDRGAPPLVLLHGWAQSASCWGGAVLSPLCATHHVVAVDLRGHGRSEAPQQGYDDPALWASDLDAVLAAAGLDSVATGTPPVLLGWSYGGLVACDYLASGGRAAGLVLVGAITALGRGKPGGRVGATMRAALPAALSTDPVTATAALAGFTSALVDVDAADGGERAQAFLGASLMAPPHVRAALFTRECDHDEFLASLDIPALVLHGTADTVVDVRAAEHAASLLRDVRTSFWDGAGHAPFAIDPQRFVAEVAAFAAHAHSVAGRMNG